MNAVLDNFDHPSWWAALGTVVSYGLVLLVMFVALFLVPYGVVRLL